MKNSRRLFLSRPTLFIILTSAVFLTLMLPSVVYLQSQSDEANQDGDKILENEEDFHPPVKMTLVKSQIGVIKPGSKISDGEDWFKGLALTVRNDSEKPITYISLRIRFPRPKGQENKLDFVERLNYGESPIPSADGQVPYNSAKPIMSGESVEIKLSDEDYNDIKLALQDSKYPPSIKKIKIAVLTLGFNDGTIWVGGKRYQLDKNNPGKLIP